MKEIKVKRSGSYYFVGESGREDITSVGELAQCVGIAVRELKSILSDTNVEYYEMESYDVAGSYSSGSVLYGVSYKKESDAVLAAEILRSEQNATVLTKKVNNIAEKYCKFFTREDIKTHRDSKIVNRLWERLKFDENQNSGFKTFEELFLNYMEGMAI